MKIHFLRHAETTAPKGSLVGSTDVGLSRTGVKQADTLAIRLPVDVPCLCSPMVRTRQTLERLQAVGVARTVTFDERLREMDFGSYELKTFSQLAQGGVDMEGWLEYTHFAFPGGESIAHFSKRLQEVLESFHADPEEQLLVLAHGGVIRTLLCLMLGLDIKNYLLFSVDHASWSTVELFSEGGVLTGLNK